MRHPMQEEPLKSSWKTGWGNVRMLPGLWSRLIFWFLILKMGYTLQSNALWGRRLAFPAWAPASREQRQWGRQVCSQRGWEGPPAMGRRDGAEWAGVCMTGDMGRAAGSGGESWREPLARTGEWKLGWSEKWQKVFPTRVSCKQLCNSSLQNTVL